MWYILSGASFDGLMPFSPPALREQTVSIDLSTALNRFTEQNRVNHKAV